MLTPTPFRARLPRLCLLIACSLVLGACSLAQALRDRNAELDETDGRPGLINLARVIETVSGTGSLPDMEDAEAETPTQWTQAQALATHALGHRALSQAPELVWFFDVGLPTDRGRIVSMEPLISENRVFHMSWEMRIHALDLATGEPLWRRSLLPVGEETAFGGGLAYQDSTLYAATGAGDVHALDAVTGETKWTINLVTPMRAGPLITERAILVTDILGRITALSPAGERLWSFDAPLSIATILGPNTPAATDQGIYAVRPDGVLVAILPTGEEAWRFDVGLQGTTGRLIDTISDSRALLVVHDDILIASSWANRTVALDPATGVLRWQIPIGGAATPFVTDDHVFLVTKDSKLRALERETGYQIWSTELDGLVLDPRAKTLNWIGPIAGGGKLLVGSNGGEILFIDPAGGQIDTRLDLNSPLIAPLALANEVLLVSTQDGSLRAYR